MKAQYVGDIGDFGKVLLLKHFARLGFRIGVNWVLTANDASSDGKHRDYVNYRGAHCLCGCDPALLEKISSIAIKPKDERSIYDLEELIREFSINSSFYSQYFDGATDRATRDDEAFKLLTPNVADLVFFDPDNGIGNRDISSPKHVYLSDLKRYWARGQSLLIYHHLPQHRPAQDVIGRFEVALGEMSDCRVKSFRLRRGTGRVYFLCIQLGHRDFARESMEIGTIAPLLLSKQGWADERKKRREFCSESHSWYRSS